jgi:hypothetical protein
MLEGFHNTDEIVVDFFRWTGSWKLVQTVLAVTLEVIPSEKLMISAQ